MGISHLAGAELKDKIGGSGLVFADFYAEWCGPCKMVSPILEELAMEYKEISFYKVNVDENPDVATEYSIFSIPTFIIFKNGKIVSQFSGAVSKESLVAELKKAETAT